VLDSRAWSGVREGGREVVWNYYDHIGEVREWDGNNLMTDIRTAISNPEHVTPDPTLVAGLGLSCNRKWRRKGSRTPKKGDALICADNALN
jgi:hypothetical protein